MSCVVCMVVCFFFFKQKTAYEMRISDWSSDVCSSDLAGDMRHEVRSKVAAGESPDAIRKWLVARYGNWVSYDPPFDRATALLWLAPLLFLAIGLWLAFGRLRGANREEEP